MNFHQVDLLGRRYAGCHGQAVHVASERLDLVSEIADLHSLRPGMPVGVKPEKSSYVHLVIPSSLLVIHGMVQP